ncbi:MAG TPA: PucR family transcriptional regulator [Micromonosporaceae bacterium]
MLPTIRDVLALDAVRHGRPRVVAGGENLDRTVRWVHSAEVPDIASLLRGGELVLTTGIGLPTDGDGLRSFIAELVDVSVAGLVVELGRRYVGRLPRVMVAAASRAGLPLVELHRTTPFVQITEAVHALIVDARLAELRTTEEIHQRFTELSVNGVEPAEVVREAAKLSDCPVVLENLARQVLAFDPAGDRADLLIDGWEQHSRRIRPAGRTGYDRDSGWLVTMVGARDQDWGRLLLRWPAAAPASADLDPPTWLTILLERAASTLALGRLIRRDAERIEQQIHRTLLTALLHHDLPVTDVALRARALGVPLDRRHLIGVAVRYRTDPSGIDPQAAEARLRDLADLIGQAMREAELTGLAGALDDRSVGALLALRDPDGQERALARFATALHRLRSTADSRSPEVVVAAGSVVAGLRDARRSLLEARQVADAARHDKRNVPVFRLPDVGLAGLLHLLRDEPRLQTFVERELGPLLAYEAEHPKERMLAVLRAYLDEGRNKSAAAARVHLSRPAFYDRLSRIGRILDADLDSVEACLSLHVALLALDAIRS